MLLTSEFNRLKENQYCDNPCCIKYNVVGLGNIKTYSKKKNQVYCNCCDNRWVVTKGTMFFDLRTPIEKVINSLLLLVRGMGVNNACRQAKVCSSTLLNWLVKAANHSNEFTTYMQQNMHLSQIQIDEFWSFIRKKKKIIEKKNDLMLN